MSARRDDIETAAKAIAFAELTPLGRKQCDWQTSFAPAERAGYRALARAALRSIDVNVRSRRVLAKALSRERKRADKLAAKLANHFRNERRYWYGEIREIVRAKGYVMIRRPGRSTHVVSEREWNSRAREPAKDSTA